MEEIHYVPASFMPEISPATISFTATPAFVAKPRTAACVGRCKVLEQVMRQHCESLKTLFVKERSLSHTSSAKLNKHASRTQAGDRIHDTSCGMSSKCISRDRYTKDWVRDHRQGTFTADSEGIAWHRLGCSIKRLTWLQRWTVIVWFVVHVLLNPNCRWVKKKRIRI